MVGVQGRDARLEAEFCCSPLPLKNTWEWGGTVLPAGSELDSKYKAELVEHPHMANCYISRLTVRGVGLRDSRPYTLMVENKHGRDTVPVLLSIKGEGDAVQGGFSSKKGSITCQTFGGNFIDTSVTPSYSIFQIPRNHPVDCRI